MKALVKILALLLTILGLSLPAKAQKQQIVIGTGVDPIFSTLYVAKAGGFFEKNGLDVQLNTGPSGSAMVAFLIKNQSQAALGGEQAGIQNFNLDPNVVLAAETATADRWWGIVGRKVPDMAALKGKKVGVAMGTGSEVFWLAVIDKLKLDPKDYTVVNVEAPEMVAALERGNIDAIAAFEPWITRTLSAISDTKVIQNNQGIILPRCYLYVNREWAEKNPSAADGLVRSLIEATALIKSDRKKAAGYVSTFLKLDQALTETLMDKLSYDVRIDQASVDYLKTIESQVKASGKLAKPVDWKAFLYSDPLKRVAPDKVTFTF